jgi:hypothetical protein
MHTVADNATVHSTRGETSAEYQYEKWMHWPVNWSAICVGALAAIALAVVCGLIGVALGAHVTAPEHRIVELKKIGMTTLAFSVFSAFLAFVIGGWVAAKIAGILRSEPAMLHGAIVWLVSVPVLVVLASLGAHNYLGGWYAGLAGTPGWGSPVAAPFDRPEPMANVANDGERSRFGAELTNYQNQLRKWKEDTPKVVRNSALGAVSALLLGLMGSVIGGWMASGEPMTLTYHRTRKDQLRRLPESL